MAETVLKVRNLKKYFHLGRGQTLQAVNDVSFDIREGETLGLVGESGCGKTTCGRTVIGMYERTEGEILFCGRDIADYKGKERKHLRQEMQMIFQDPYAALNPRMTVSEIIGEGIDIHHLAAGRREREERINELLRLVELNPEHAGRFIHEFSGGQRQRIGIARALALEPRLLILDEPISALDVSIQAQIVNMLVNLQRELGLTYLFIAHDLAMVKYISDRVAVMYLGRLVEMTRAEELYATPLHPYTQALLSAIPIADPEVEKRRESQRIPLEGETISPINPRPGCLFAGRCRYATARCRQETPALQDMGNEHWVACHLVKG